MLIANYGRFVKPYFINVDPSKDHLIYGKVQVELFRTFELTINFYVYKHCGLYMFITLFKINNSNGYKIIKLDIIVKEYTHKFFYKVQIWLHLHRH